MTEKLSSLSKSHALAVALESNTIATAVAQLFDYLPEVQFWIKDRKGRYVTVNRGFLLNYAVERVEDIRGKTDFDLSPGHLADQFRMDDAMVLGGQAVIHRVELVGRFDHTAVWSVTTKLPIAGARGAVVGTVGITSALHDEPTAAQDDNVALGKTITFIRRHYPRPLANEELAKVAGLSIRALERQFRQAFQLSPQQYLKRLRVRMACYDLVHTTRALVDIAAAHRFCDQSHFSREFRRQTGMTPRQYRLRFQSSKQT